MITNNSKFSLTVLILIAAALFTVLILGAYNIYSKNEKSKELLNSVNQTAETRTLDRSIKSVQNNAAKDLITLNNFIFSDDKLVSLIESIEGAGQAFGIDASIVSVGKIENKDNIGSSMVRIIIDTQGHWSGTLAFVRAIENLPYRVMIDESSLFRNEDGWRSRIVLSLHIFD
ncbi:MAG: hypothetical protein COX06_01335 [Candidatus Zambryskibacteria bacterium CG22_combo_CG10-13_8_21_14_all_42_17]|uniref:Uncharacterized protein n=1 Tax=Candidatus Zambryskibacteria bacterium CG22_combo_CG10-13_8_21_14_all_42_17 TaxID=1975118 RepID=A0A2H0BFN6_9BACT|nr:MAG: hypothetical protein COX06_01335 [Candidatus Zambryskibacteria bacterium CG22_combo_CG10-13_8_21_14_all_42_17]